MTICCIIFVLKSVKQVTKAIDGGRTMKNNKLSFLVIFFTITIVSAIFGAPLAGALAGLFWGAVAFVMVTFSKNTHVETFEQEPEAEAEAETTTNSSKKPSYNFTEDVCFFSEDEMVEEYYMYKTLFPKF